MKSPWKIVGQFLPWGKTEPPAAENATDEQSRETPTPSHAISHPQTSEFQPVGEPGEALSRPGSFNVDAAGLEEKTEVGVNKTARRDARRRPAPAVASPSIAPKMVAVVPPTHVAKNNRSAGDMPTDHRNELPSLERGTVYADIIRTDVEIRVLIHQLMGRLREQNDQLRKMLQRFGGS
jgi:hypothetical protein